MTEKNLTLAGTNNQTKLIDEKDFISKIVTRHTVAENGTNTRFCLVFRYFLPKIID